MGISFGSPESVAADGCPTITEAGIRSKKLIR
jgi:hypothetical protein